MARRYGNLWARLGAGFMGLSHQRAPAFRWGVIFALAVVWLWAGYNGWVKQGDVVGADGVDLAEAAYRTAASLGPESSYNSPPNVELQVARFAGIALPLMGLLLAFSAQLGRSVAQLFNHGAADHVVIAGGGPAAMALADDCVKRGDVVTLIAPTVMEETTQTMRAHGVTVIQGDAARPEVLRGARAHKAAHVVAFEDSEARNLHIEAAVRTVAQRRGHRAPLAVHTAMATPMLLQEAREMRSREQSALDKAAKAKGGRPPRVLIDAKPFSLHEVAARRLIQTCAPTWLSLAHAANQPRLHLVLFGFDGAAEAVAVRTLMAVWSAHFEPPRITVVTPDPRQTELRFRARYPQAVGYPTLWNPDIAFHHGDWTMAPIDQTMLAEIGRTRGPATAAVVATGDDEVNIRIGLTLLRTCNQGGFWPIPIYLHEESASEFSRQYAAGDRTPDQLDAFLEAFGARETLATRDLVLEGAADRGAAIAHAYYVADIGQRDAATMRDLQAAARGWGTILETYRAANRGSADSALVKLWDAGWIPAPEAVPGDNSPTIDEALLPAMAKREHDRWTAERLLAGWRPGPRDNELMTHPNLKGWDELTQDEQNRDVAQVKSAIDVGRLLVRRGFVRRP